MGLRERNRRAAMQETQRTALGLFQQRGFGNVTVGDVAGEVGMAESTVFRHFGSKEQLVIWDEHDVALGEHLVRLLRDRTPFAALRDAFVDTLASRYDNDLKFQLERVGYIYATEALHAAAVEADFAARTELAEALTESLSTSDRNAAPLLAGAALLALDIALNQWQQERAQKPLADYIAAAFATLAALETLE